MPLAIAACCLGPLGLTLVKMFVDHSAAIALPRAKNGDIGGLKRHLEMAV